MVAAAPGGKSWTLREARKQKWEGERITQPLRSRPKRVSRGTGFPAETKRESSSPELEGGGSRNEA